MGSCDQFSTDLMVGGGDTVTISHTSKKATVHITGYKQEDIFDEDDDSLEGAEEYQILGEDDPLPEEQKVKIRRELQAMAGMQMGEVKEADSEEEEEDEDSDFELEDEDAMGSEDSESMEEGDDGEDSSSSEEELAAGKKEVPGTAALARGIIADDDESDSDSDSDSDSSSSSSDDDGKELQKLKGRKRVVPDTKSSEGTPTESKKRSKTSPSTPASTSSTPGKTPVLGDAKSYEADLVNFLRVNGETTMAIIGTRVKKPSGVPKLGQFIETRAGVFKRNGDKIDLA